MATGIKVYNELVELRTAAGVMGSVDARGERVERDALTYTAVLELPEHPFPIDG
jgi:hypothetical protein